MDYNLVVLYGKLAAKPELREFQSGSHLVRVLVTVRTESPKRRVDVVPVIYWNLPRDHFVLSAPVGTRINVTGQIQRRFMTDEDGARNSRIEVICHSITLQQEEEEDDDGS